MDGTRGRRRSAQAKRGGPRGCWARTSRTLIRNGSERRTGSRAVTEVGKTRAASTAGPAAGALPNAQCSMRGGFTGCRSLSCGREGAGKSARQIVRENRLPLAGMKPTGISARNTKATSRMLVTSSRLRRLNRADRMPLSAYSFSARTLSFPRGGRKSRAHRGVRLHTLSTLHTHFTLCAAGAGARDSRSCMGKFAHRCLSNSLFTGLLFAALAVRALIPVGFMPVAGNGGSLTLHTWRL